MKLYHYSLPLIVLLLTGCSESPDESKQPEDHTPKVQGQPSVPIPSPGAGSPRAVGVPNEPSSPMRQRVVDRFTKWFGDISTQATMSIDKAQVAWRESWLPHYNDQLASASDARIEQGLELPSEVATLKPPAKPYFIQAREGQLDLAEGEQETESLMCLHMLLVGVMLEGGYRLPELLSERANSLPPTRGDLFTLQIFRDAMQLRERAGVPLSESQAAAWERMSKAANPIYRHIALSLYPRIAPSNEAALQFFHGAAHESDTQNLLLIVSGIEALPSGMGLSYLEDLQNHAKESDGNSRVATAIAAAIASIKQRSR